MTITSEEFKRVSFLIKSDPCDQCLKGGEYGETYVSYRMKLPSKISRKAFTHLELIDRYDCADGVILGSKIIAQGGACQLVLAEMEMPMNDHVITSFWEDDHDALEELESERTFVMREVSKNLGRARAA